MWLELLPNSTSATAFLLGTGGGGGVLNVDWGVLNVDWVLTDQSSKN